MLTSDAPQVALAHDYLTQRGGAERVVLAMTRAFPGAPLTVSLHDPAGTFPEFRDVDVRTLAIDRLAPLRRRHRLALPLLAPAFATARVAADVVLCSSSGWAHAIGTRGRKIVYCHSPAKWLWRRDDYLGAHPSRLSALGLSAIAPALRRFDLRAAAGADTYLANSTFIARQIAEVYGIEAEVLHPPAGVAVDGPEQPIAGVEPGFVLTVARLLPYKNVGPTIDAFRLLPGERLVVVGDGPLRDALSAGAPANVTLVGEVDDARLRWLYRHCAALVAASREDFGLTPVEAAAHGKPVAALGWGGFLDTVVPGVTGLHFADAAPRSIAEAVEGVLRGRWDAGAVIGHAGAFAEERFARRLQEVVAGR